MRKVYPFVVLLFLTLAAVAQTTETTQTVKKTTTTTTTSKAKPVKAKAKKTTVKAKTTTTTAKTAGASTPSSSKGTTPSPSSSSTRTSINQPTSPATSTPQPTNTPVTGASRGGASTTTTTTTTTTPTNTNTTTNTTTNTNPITELDAASALRDALSSGITSAVTKTSALNGFLNNAEIKIPFPQNAQVVQTALTDLGLGSLTDQVVTSLNRAAENAAVQATPIFLGSIRQLTFTDAINIVDNSQPDAATQFLQRVTTEQLVAAFKPSIKTALDNAQATKYWGTIMSEYNKIPFVQQIETDLPDYVTRKAISGLFVMVAKEEANIRKNPFGQTSPMVKKVFGRTLAR